jgi:hypothetical protein
MTSVVNLHEEPYDVFIGNPSKWRNQFVIGKLNRWEVVELYRTWIMGKPELLNALGELRGKRLGCYCRPQLCHGVVLLDLIQEKFGGNRINDFELED